MSQRLIEIAKMVVNQATKLGASGCRALVFRSHTGKVEWRDGKLDRTREYTRMGLELTLFVNNRHSSSSTNDLRPEALEVFVKDSLSMTRLLQKDPHWKLPDPAYYEGQFQGDLGIFDKQGVSQISVDQRKHLASQIEQAARASRNAERIISVSSECSEVNSQSAMVCSNGMQGERQSSYFSMSAECSVRGKGDRKPEGYDYVACRRKQDLPSAQRVGQKATERALMCIGEEPLPSGVYSCVIENRVLARLLSGLRRALDGRAVQQKRSYLADKLGQQILSSRLTISDDPHLFGGLGSCLYDAEGMATKRRTIFDKGRPQTLFLNTYYASKLGQKPTTGWPANIVFDLGNADLDQMVKQMDKGILITGFIGGNSNSATGDFSVGIRGHWIENGKPIRPIAEMNLAGNHLTFWKKVAQIGNDANPYSSWCCPSIRFEPVQFSGI